jgi:hypothetical protein
VKQACSTIRLVVEQAVFKTKKWKEQFVRLMLEDDDEKQEQLLRRLQADMARNIVPVRQLKGRGRKWNYFNKYKCNQKPSF